MREKKYLIIAIISLICLVASVMTYQLHKGSALAGGVCDAFGSLSQCDKVGASSYAHLLGFDNAIIGCIGFSVLIFLSIYQFFKPNELYDDLINLGSLIAGTGAIYFIFVQIFILKAYCVYCVVVDTLSLILLALALHSIVKMISKK